MIYMLFLNKRENLIKKVQVYRKGTLPFFIVGDGVSKWFFWGSNSYLKVKPYKEYTMEYIGPIRNAFLKIMLVIFMKYKY